MSGSDPELQLPIALTLDDHAGPAPRMPRERLAALVDTALLEYDRVNPARPARSDEPSASRASKTPKATATSPWAVAAGTALALIGGAAAARFIFHESAAETPKPVAAPVVPAQPQALPSPEIELELETEPQPASTSSPSGEGPTDATEKGASDDVSTGPANDQPYEKGRHAVVRRVSVPEDLLQKANRQRAAGQFRSAAQTYTLVYDRFPKSQAAYVARVAAGSLELEHLSNPTGARKLFEQALAERPRGALDLEARQGLSVALRDLEDRAGERSVLRTLVRRHPGSPAARRAQVRLLELGGE